MPGAGTYSSPRMTDLNGDGILDVVIGSGAREERSSDTAVMAIDGSNGKILWRINGVNQFVGSAVFQDVNDDQVDDVFIGGRWAELAAISGADGKIIWRFLPSRRTPDAASEGWYNFTSPQWVPDQDGDGYADLLIANGGNARAAAGDTNRPAGRLVVFSARTGKLLASATVPDGRETYLSPVIADTSEEQPGVLFGTGGESMGGHLYRTTLADIMHGDLSRAKPLSAGLKKGFIASPVYADIDGDGVYDVIVNKVEGEMEVIDGATDSLIWKLTLPGTEAYTNPAPGYFNDDTVPDIFCNYAIGVFPNLPRSVRFIADGRTGKIMYADTINAFQYASAVVFDADGDGRDEVLVHQSEARKTQFENLYYSYPQVIDYNDRRTYSFGDTVPATNLASTPWLGDADGDGQLDMVTAAVKYHDVKFDLEQPLGLFVEKRNTPVKLDKPLRWSGYMGSDGRNVFYQTGRTFKKK